MVGHRLRRLLWCVTAAASLALAAPALAQEPGGDDAARTHFESGRLHFERGEYERAVSAFQAAYELSPRPGLLYNLYLTLERLGRYGEAADRLEQFLVDDEALAPERRADLEVRVANLRERGRAAAQPDPPPPPVATPAQGLSGLGLTGAIALGVGGATLAAFAITGGMALAEDESVAGRCGRDAGRTCTEQDVADLRTLTTTADVLLTVGVVLAAAGATLLAIDLASGGGDERVSLAPMLGPGFAGVVVEGTR